MASPPPSPPRSRRPVRVQRARRHGDRPLSAGVRRHRPACRRPNGSLAAAAGWWSDGGIGPVIRALQRATDPLFRPILDRSDHPNRPTQTGPSPAGVSWPCPNTYQRIFPGLAARPDAEAVSRNPRERTCLHWHRPTSSSPSPAPSRGASPSRLPAEAPRGRSVNRGRTGYLARDRGVGRDGMAQAGRRGSLHKFRASGALRGTGPASLIDPTRPSHVGRAWTEDTPPKERCVWIIRRTFPRKPPDHAPGKPPRMADG